MPIGVGHCFAIFFVVIDVDANIFASMSMTWFVLGETGQERGISMILCGYDFFIRLSERNRFCSNRTAGRSKKGRSEMQYLLAPKSFFPNIPLF